MAMTRQEAGKLGGLASIASSKLRRLTNEARYLQSPKFCKQCKVALSYEDSQRKKIYCDSSCAAKDTRSAKGFKYSCLACGKPIPSNKQCCNAKCDQHYKYTRRLVLWDAGETPCKAVIKRWLTETFGCKCSVCGITEWQSKTLIFDLEHKDGNSENNSKGNVCLICPNCHSQTGTFKGKNKGNGRHSRRKRYNEGKSY